jgi:hypothetical protein
LDQKENLLRPFDWTNMSCFSKKWRYAMKKTKLVASCLAVGIFAISASVQASSRTTLTAVPLGERFAPSETTRASAVGLIYENIVPGGFFFPQAPETLEDQLTEGIADDLSFAPGNARELSSYAALIHQRSSEGPLGFTVHLSLQVDDGTEPSVDSMPVHPGAVDGASCSVPDIHGLGRPDEAFAECVPNPAGDSGIILDEKVWLRFVIEGGCIGVNTENLDDCPTGKTSLGPGMLLTAGEDAAIGSTLITFAQQLGDLQILTNFVDGNTLPAEMRAGVPAPVPTVSEWGMVLIAMLVLTGGTIVLRRSRTSVATA